MKITKNFYLKITSLTALLAICSFASFAQRAIKLNVDATDAPRNILHVKETMPAQAGQLTLFYPKWIPGEHAPTGTINDMVNLFISVDGSPLEWQRDDVEMFAFHCNIPAGANQIEIAFDDVSQPGTTASAWLARIKWNRLLLYPEGVKSDDLLVTASLKLPANWQYGTALPVERETPNAVDFRSVTLTTLVDSPAQIGKNFKKVQLLIDNGVSHEVDIAADTPEALEFKPETLAGWKNLIKEANLAFGAKHYNIYRFLLTLSDIGGSEGLEHHESSEDGVGLKAFSDEFELIDLGDLLGHEYAHSWNGKHRRPASLTTSDFEQPMKGDLLWIYEGLTEYLGRVFPARSRLWTPEVFRDVIAETAASMDYQSGRRWRSVVDTARAVQFTYASPRAWMNERRRVDYYYEGSLIWLEADVLIRQKSNGRLSLDDFLRQFHGGQNSAPAVKTYDFDEVVQTLNKVLPYDWRTFLTERVYQLQKNAPLGGVTNGGWQLVYNETPNIQMQVDESTRKFVNLSYSIGISLNEKGEILDVNPNLSAAKAGLAPGMKIMSVNNQTFSSEILRRVIARSKDNSSPIQLLVDNGGFIETYDISYHEGERYPHLVRDASRRDFLSEIIKSH